MFRRVFVLPCLLAGLVVSLLAAVLLGNAGAASASDNAMFRAGTLWRGQFAAPSVLQVGDTYWAFATTTGGDNVPSEHSTNLRDWYAHAPYPSDSNPGWWSGYNDTLPHPASWALYYIHRNGHDFTSVWAPSVALVGDQYVMAYAVATGNAQRHCISLATAPTVSGPYVDNSTGPLVCSSDPGGTIDPQLLQPGDGNTYLVWKNAGVRGSTPTEIWSRQMNTTGTGFAPGTRAHFLLATKQRWEGNVIENPAMIQYGSRYYLFYSGNTFTTTHYATGYATCAGPLGPCRRPAGGGPLLATNASTAGPGGATPFIGPRGQLELAYAAWDTGHSGPSDPVRMHIATLSVDPRGLLHVAARG